MPTNMIARECLTQWANTIKPKKFTIPDSYSVGPITNLTNLLNGVFKTKSPSEQSASNSIPQSSWFRGYHFIFSCQQNQQIGSDGYDNYQAPLGDNHHQLYLRRLWARGSIQFIQPPKINSALTCTEQVQKVKPYNDDVFVDIDRKFTSDEGELLLVESRTMLYTNQLYTSNKSPKLTENEPKVTVKISPIDLLKYSMLTYNLHRIHFDPKYAHSVENLPTLLVHGPFQVTLILYYFGLQYPDLIVQQLKYRTYEPFFVNDEAGISIVAKGSNEFQLTLFSAEQKIIYLQGTLKCK
ncbi:hypothetical protein KGF57_000214 [Candida theae]|uniref:MaoC-like domain-containing protein n=1 Tax=Candida theae TaxID=1198502 RepID=A0AAD5BK60_9ASCO|nr:uncharacterized protein KGF57_000214 [Candida theae]KAI5968355.1 hypothetical protein KGF57_000214 [Candida theae]